MFTTRRQLPASELAADARLPLGVLDLAAEVALQRGPRAATAAHLNDGLAGPVLRQQDERATVREGGQPRRKRVVPAAASPG
jgi:hypothetical protein